MRNFIAKEQVFKEADVATLRVVDQQTIPYHYMPGENARIIITQLVHKE